jgi:hypothetical protein
MPESRRAERIKQLGTAWIQYEGIRYYCQILNVSTMGALAITKEPIEPVIPKDAICCATIYNDHRGLLADELFVRVVHSNPPSLGLEFIKVDKDTEEALNAIVNKEKHFFVGAQTIIDTAGKLAAAKGIELSELYFDKGDLDLELEVHCLRFFAGKRKVMVHFDRDEIEQYQESFDSDQKIYNAVEKLHVLINSQI